MWRGWLLGWVVVFEELGKAIEVVLTDDEGEEEGVTSKDRNLLIAGCLD